MKKREAIFFLCCAIAFFPLFFWVPDCDGIENNECLDCHGDPSLARAESSGMKETLYVSSEKFKYSVHHVNGVGCTDCHAGIEELDYEREVPHAVELGAVRCGACHEEVSEAYNNSVHKKAGEKGISIPCYACHEYHYTTRLATATVTERQNSFCRKCHDPDKFHDWLPQKETHFAFVECAVCHAPDSPKHINLRLYDLVEERFLDTDDMLRALNTDIDGFMPLVDRNEDGIINADEFEDLVIMLRRWEIRATFHGELVADIKPTVHHVNRGQANEECKSCHTVASPFFEDVRIGLLDPEGELRFFGVDRGVLETYHVEFNALGNTRVRLLDKIGIALIIGAVGVVVLHLTTRILTVPLRNRNGKNNA